MYIQNAVYKAVPTGSIEFPVAEGTIITVGGVTGIVPQNVALAPPMAMIYVATGGTIDLTSEANKDVTFTEEQIKELGADFNFIPASEGGGGSSLPQVTSDDNGDVLAVVDGEWAKAPAPSSLPSYTASDKGKVLTLGEGSESETVVVVPEQTVTVDGGSALVPLSDFSNVSVGDSFVLTVNDSTFTGTVSIMQGALACIEEETEYEYGVGYIGEQTIFTGTEVPPGTYTISLTVSVPSVEPKWEVAGGGLPEYTESDKGKNLAVQIVDGTPVVTSIIPEQSVTTSAEVPGLGYYAGTLTGVDVSLIQEDVPYNVTVDNVEYADILFSGGMAIIAEVPCGLMIDGSDLLFLTLNSGETHTVLATKETIPQETIAGWAENPLIVHVSLSGGIWSADRSYDELQAAEKSGIPIFMTLGRWGLNLGPCEWYEFGSAYTAQLLHTTTSGGKTYLEMGEASISENGFSLTWLYRVELTAVPQIS